MNTMQQEFDAVVAHLYTQKVPATMTLGIGTGCYYRLPQLDGSALSCAVGCRIPDSVYSPLMDKPDDGSDTTVECLVGNFGSVLPPEIVAYTDLFSLLQQVHDNPANTNNGVFALDRLETELRRVAAEFNLTFTVPQGV